MGLGTVKRRSVFLLDLEFGVVNDPLDVVAQSGERLFVLLRNDGQVFRTSRADSLSFVLNDFVVKLPHVVLEHENTLGFDRNRPRGSKIRHHLVA